MNIIKQSCKLRDYNLSEEEAIGLIAKAAFRCYSGDRADNDGRRIEDYQKFLHNLKARKHMSPFEHFNITAIIKTDIATYKALTRHRFCSFTIESTHFIGYKDGLTVIEVPDISVEVQDIYFKKIEEMYLQILHNYGKMVARSFLPQAQAASLTMTTNIREWFHIFDLRKGKENTTNMWMLMEEIMNAFRLKYPFFMELYESTS